VVKHETSRDLSPLSVVLFLVRASPPRHSLRGPESYKVLHVSVRFEVFTAVTVKNGVFWDITPCIGC
jgi:hypothetical protein